MLDRIFNRPWKRRVGATVGAIGLFFAFWTGTGHTVTLPFFQICDSSGNCASTDGSNSLQVNIKAGAGSGTGSPAYTRIQGGANTIALDVNPPGTNSTIGAAAIQGVLSGVPVSVAFQNSGGGGTSAIPIVCDKSAAVTISSATTTAIVAVSGSKAVYVCGYHLQTSGTTAPTFQFEYGAGTACATSPTALTGAFTPGTTAAELAYGNGLGTVFQTPASQGLCLVTGGTTPIANGVVSYAQF